MSDLIKNSTILNSGDCLKLPSQSHSQKLNIRTATLGDNLTIRRALPHQDRKMIGAWCFLDHFGPLNLKTTKGLNIGPHPHIGLQTFTYLIAGEILHRDSLGSQQLIQAGQVNLMTAGKGITHSEESLSGNMLQGVQLWIALPDDKRHMDPCFTHYSQTPTIPFKGLQIKVLVGEFINSVSPVLVHTPLSGLEVSALEDTTLLFPLKPHFEYGILPLSGKVQVEHETIDENAILYLPCGNSELPLQMNKNSRILIIGGEPFKEDILIWWNFVARKNEEIIAATSAWNNQTFFGEVKGYQGNRLTAPKLPDKINK